MWKTLLFTLCVVCCFQNIQNTCLTENATPRGRSASRDDISEAILSYTLDQYKHMATDSEYDSENIFTSPYSIWAALATTYLGSRGNTEHDMARLLGLAGFDKTQVHDKIDELQKSLTSDVDTFTVANMIAFERSVQLRGCLSKNPLLEIASLKFRENNAESINRVNRWVSSVTKNKINNILDAQTVTTDTIMLILNAVYFRASWKYEFSPQNTQKDFFIVSPKEIREVEMMQLQTLLPYTKLRHLEASAVELPYAGDKYSMILILPDDRDININDIIGKITIKDIQELPEILRERSVTVQLPKTEIEAKYNLNKMISDLGVSSIFRGADLRGFIRAGPPVRISDVVHQAYIKINEEGTEAAAASASVTSTRGSHNGHITLKFNRPHIFMIKDNVNDVIVFMGLIRKPQGTSFRASRSQG